MEHPTKNHILINSNAFCCFVDSKSGKNCSSSERSEDEDLVEDREVTHEELNKGMAPNFPHLLDGSESDDSVHYPKSNSKKENDEGNKQNVD